MAALKAPDAPQWTAQQWTVFNAFNDEALVRDQMDVQQTPLYDTVTIAAGGTLSVTTSAFFTNVGANSNKTIAQTNLLQANILQAPEAFSIIQFRLRWSEDILRADLTTILNGFVFEFFIGKKIYMQLPIWMIPAGGGIAGTTTRTAESFYTNGWPTVQAARTLALPLVISSTANFQGQLNGNAVVLAAAPGVGAILVLVCEGLYARGVR